MRRNGRDERRRRVLRDDPASAEVGAVEAGESPGSRAHREGAGRDNLYQESARSDQQPKLIDFVPRRGSLVFVCLLLQLNLFAALQSLHWWFFESAAPGDRAWLSFFDLARDGSLASWLMSVWFLMAAVLCGLLFSVRRHRRDDFQGRYRVWGWLAAAMVAISACVVTGFDLFAGEVARRLAPSWGPLSEGAWSASHWAVALVSCVTIAVTVRMWFDFRESRLATFLVAATLACFVLAAVCRLELFPVGPFDAAYLATSCQLLGATLLATTCLEFCRFVVRDAHGEIRRRAAEASPSNRATRRREKAEQRAEKRAEKRARQEQARQERAAEKQAAAEARAADKAAQQQREDSPDNSEDDSVDDQSSSSPLGRRASRSRRRRQEQAAASEGKQPDEAAAEPPSVQITRDGVQSPNGDDELSEEELAKMSKAERRRYRKQRKRRAA